MDCRVTTLDTILKYYKEKYSSNAIQLRRSIPAKEIWRFFVNGDDQEVSRAVSEVLSLDADVIKLSVAEVEKKHHDLRVRLKTMDWALTEKETLCYTIEDLYHLDRAWLAYEHSEPGYLQAMHEAFDLLFDPKGKLDLAFIKKLHGMATKNVEMELYTKDEKMADSSKKGEIRCNNNSNFALGAANTTKKGIVEFLEKNDSHINIGILNKLKEDFYIDKNILQLLHNSPPKEIERSQYSKHSVYYENFLNTYSSDASFRSVIDALSDQKNLEECYDYIHTACSKDTLLFSLHSTFLDDTSKAITERIEIILKNYNDGMDEVKKLKLNVPWHTLKNIIVCIQSLEQLHPFLDGNCRTFCMLLLNFLLMREGFPPVILTDPNKFDMYSVDELMSVVLQGMQNTFDLLDKHFLFNVKTDEVLKYISSKKYLHHKSEHFSKCIEIENNNRKKYLDEAKLNISIFDTSKIVKEAPILHKSSHTNMQVHDG